MKAFLAKLRNAATAGFFVLLPVYVLFIILTKAWSSLSSLGGSIAGMFGMKSILGVGGNTVFSGLLLITIWIACGLLVRVSFVAGFSNRVETFYSSTSLGTRRIEPWLRKNCATKSECSRTPAH